MAKSASIHAADQDRPLLEVPYKGLLTLAVMSATVLQVLDTTIANIALPHMQAALGATQDSVTWVLTSYIVAIAIAIPITGWLADRVGSRPLFLASVFTFVIASMLCGISITLEEMVLFRLLQGISGAFIIPLAQTVLLDINSRSEHGKAMAIYGMGIMIGPILGPIIGGWLTENMSWRWVFYVNVPIGILSLGLLWFLLPARPIVRRRFDLSGFVMLALGLGTLQLLLDRGQHVDWFNSTEIWIETGIVIGAFWMFGIHILTAKSPLYNRKMLRDRNLISGILFILILGMLHTSVMALLPPLLQTLLGYPVLDTGILLSTRGFGVLVSMWFVSRVIANVDVRTLIFVGFSVTALSLWMMTGWSIEMDWKPVIISGLVQGFGLGLIFVPINALSFATLAEKWRTEASAMLNLMRNLGSSFGIAILSALLARNVQVSHSDIAQHINSSSLPIDPNIAGTLGQAGDMAMAMLNAEITRQATMIAYLNDFKLMLIATIAVLPLILLLKAPVPKEKDQEEAIIMYAD